METRKIPSPAGKEAWENSDFSARFKLSLSEVDFPKIYLLLMVSLGSIFAVVVLYFCRRLYLARRRRRVIATRINELFQQANQDPPELIPENNNVKDARTYDRIFEQMIKRGTKVDESKIDMSSVAEGYNLNFIEHYCSKEDFVPNSVTN